MRKHTQKILFVSLLFFLATLCMRAQYDPWQFLLRGRQCLAEGKYAAAIDNLNITERLDNSLYEAFFYRGIAKYNLGDYTGAKSDFDKTLELNPLYTPAYHYRAITLSQTGHYDLALNDFKEALDLRPDYTGLYFSRGVTYLLSQQFEKAIEDFDRFIRREPRESDAFLNRGACRLFLGDTLKALEDYNQAISINRFDPEGYIRRSRIYAQQEKWEEAENDLNLAISLDTTNTFAYFNRALLRYESKNINGSLSDLNRVLNREPGNSLTLYNRAIIRSTIGDLSGALDDYDHVLNINPDNVLAYFNRAGVFLEMGRYRDAMNDYSHAIDLYPDFAKAYMNRSYVKNKLGQHRSAEKDYKIAQEKVAMYRKATADSTSAAAFADTTKKYDSLLALDSDFAKKDFNDELLQWREINITLKPLFKLVYSPDGPVQGSYMLSRKWESKVLEAFLKSLPIDMAISTEAPGISQMGEQTPQKILESLRQVASSSRKEFASGVIEAGSKQFNNALAHYDEAIRQDPGIMYYYLNRGVLQSEMIDFISSMESNVQVLSLDNAGTARARVQDRATRSYDYSAAIADMEKAVQLMPDFPYAYYNLGNLYCLSGNLPESIAQYGKALKYYPNLGEAYYNRGLVLIYVKDLEKGCIDLSKAGELGVTDAYSVIQKYCVKKQ